MDELSWLLTVYELAFLLFWVKEAAQVEDDGQKEHEARHSDDRHRLLTGEGTTEILTPQFAGHIHLKGESAKRNKNFRFGWQKLQNNITIKSTQFLFSDFNCIYLLIDEARRGSRSVIP